MDHFVLQNLWAEILGAQKKILLESLLLVLVLVPLLMLVLVLVLLLLIDDNISLSEAFQWLGDEYGTKAAAHE